MSAPGYPPVPAYGYPGDQNQQQPNFDPYFQQYPDQAAVLYPVEGVYQPQAPYQQPGAYTQPGPYPQEPGYYQPPTFYSPQPEHYPEPYAQPPSVYPQARVSPPQPDPTPEPAPAHTTLDPSLLRQAPPPVTLKLRLNPTPDTMNRRGSSSIVKDESFSSSGRPTRSAKLAAERKFVSYAEESDEDGEGEDEVLPTRRTGRSTAGKSAVRYSDEDRPSPVRERRSRRHHPDPDEDDEVVQPARKAFPTRSTRHNSVPAEPKPERRDSADEYVEPSEPSATEEDEPSDDPVMNQYGTPSEEDDFIEYDDRPRPRRTARKPTRRSTRNSNRRQDSEDEYGAPKRQLRQRTSKVNYELPPLDISAELMQEAITNVAGPSRRRGVGFPSARFKGMPWAPGSLPQAMGDVDTSESDLDMMVPKTAGVPGVQGPRPAGPSDVPNFGRVNPKSNLADADPLGVDMNVTFDNVGGLDNHINQLKEMVALPLLYPELFQKFGLTPPRGVLFHGPPGTGKTLLARALAASCSTGNTKIAFFMRKGADVLSKWVGEAERQLRMLFEEARANQPSIIFFDEIDGLAPVRSSKQDQIHASLVSTLLALMDGMDGRGQVIVIGATNRPDAVDSALRRPGRFDREFYFPLPNREARRKIIQINTREWSPQLSEPLLDRLSVMTKGYGGADLRALCTEAALNAIQRRYPQIYKSADRLQLDHGSIAVGAKDFMMSIQKITPSSARSTASAASQLPTHLVPLLSAPLDRLKTAVDRILPRHKHLTALEEAEFVDDIGDDLDKHMMVQSLDKLRTFRPRLLIHGPPGMGQTYLGPAILHHLEGFHVQSLDIGTLMADSTRTPEATLVQLFVEAKRHQPSILFIPSLLAWSHALTDSARTTFQSLLDGVSSSDPVLLLAMADVPAHDIPRDIRSWFGASIESRAELTTPTIAERHEYLASLFDAFNRPPVDFPDALPRQKRILEDLPLAAPLPPRQPTEAEIQRELDRDQNARTMMIISFTSLVQEFLKKFRKVVAGVRDDAFVVTQMLADQVAAAAVPTIEIVEPELPNGHSEALVDPAVPAPAEPAEPIPAPDPPVAQPTWQAHDVDIDTLHRKLLRHKYHTPADFLDDVAKIEDNAAHIGDADRQARVAEMAANARMHVSHFDPKWTPEFERLKVRMKMRREERDKEKAKEAEAQTGDQADIDLATAGEGSGSQENEASLKRRREEETDDRNGKRPRDDAMEVELESQHSAVTISPTTLATVPEPRLVAHPPFVLPSHLWHEFESTLRDDTADLSIDDLEQIRAGCFDRLWRRRGDWDRTEVVRECLDWARDHMKEIRELREESD